MVTVFFSLRSILILIFKELGVDINAEGYMLLLQL